MIVQQKIKDLDISVVAFKEFQSIDINELIELFEDKKKDGFIQNEFFNDNIWSFYNEKVIKRLSFQFDELLYNRSKVEGLTLSLEDMTNALKGYVLYKIQEFSLTTVYSALLLIKKCIEQTNFLQPSKYKVLASKKITKDSNYFEYVHLLIEFLEFMSFDNEDIMTLLYHQKETYNVYRLEKQGALNQRDLSTFESMFELDYVLDQFWDTCSSEDKEKYYPIKLWWAISTIIPVRTTELTIIPYDCLEIIDGRYYLKLRRTKLKGNQQNRPPIRHKIDEDYYIHPIEINKDLYTLIQEYRDLVDDYDFQPQFYYGVNTVTQRRRFLFSHRAYHKHQNFSKIAIKLSDFLDYFTPGNLNTLLKNFYQDILVKTFNYELILKGTDESIKPYQLEYVNIMDTRHFAFINMALNDVEPLIMKSISGHASIKSSYHYYSHLDKYVKCYTYNMARKMQKREMSKQDIKIIHTAKSRTSELVFRQVFDSDNWQNDSSNIPISGGYCRSKQKEYEDCMQADNHCDYCPYFVPSQTEAQKSIIQSVRDNEQKINVQVEALKDMVKQYDKIKNFNEDYGLKINIIKTIANQNAVMMSKYFI
ncbi:hypothetical protein [Paenibacillus sp. GXUN7292]|uniref:hypothetical protein n=1 Tax=Paenibacillus sp. GXUN7292 TaxID=3422499 RepID=UPI003D7E798B